MDDTKFVAENLKRQTLRKLSRRIETGVAKTVPVFIGGRWATHLVRLRRRNLQLSVAEARFPSALPAM